MTGFAAVVLAGGAARRMGGADKPARLVGGRSMRDRVLDAVVDADPRILVGPLDRAAVGEALPVDVRATRERPAGGGPVAAAAAGLALLDPDTETVALLAADLPLLTREVITDLRRLLTGPARPGSPPPDGVCCLDADGRRQTLCGVWRVTPLRSAVDRLRAARGGDLTGASVRALLTGLVIRDLPWSGSGLPPWFDCDTDDDVRRVEEWRR